MSDKAIANWGKLVGHAVLVERHPDHPHPRYNGIFEYVLLAISPSGEHLKMETESGGVFWTDRSNYILLEDLGPMEDKA